MLLKSNIEEDLDLKIIVQLSGNSPSYTFPGQFRFGFRYTVYWDEYMILIPSICFHYAVRSN